MRDMSSSSPITGCALLPERLRLPADNNLSSYPGRAESPTNSSRKIVDTIYSIGYSVRMNVVKALRQKAGLTQLELARYANTSQSTIAAYEGGKKSPTLATLARIATAIHYDLRLDFFPAMTREDRRSLAFHEAIVDRIRLDPGTITHAKRNVRRLKQIHPDAQERLNRWESWLALPTDDLATLILGTSEVAREMRHVSPFSGVLTPKERAQIIARFRQEAAV